jgi:hypothetical protein
LAVKEAGPRFGRFREARFERRGVIDLQNAEIAQREALEVLARLAEIQVEQKLKRLRSRESQVRMSTAD